MVLMSLCVLLLCACNHNQPMNSNMPHTIHCLLLVSLIVVFYYNEISYYSEVGSQFDVMKWCQSYQFLPTGREKVR